MPVRAARPHALPAPPVGFHPDAFEQLLLWEELADVRAFREGSRFFGLKVAAVDAAKVDVQATSQVRTSKVLAPSRTNGSDSAMRVASCLSLAWTMTMPDGWSAKGPQRTSFPAASRAARWAMCLRRVSGDSSLPATLWRTIT